MTTEDERADYAIGDLRLDLGRGVLMRAGKIVQVRPKTFALLSHLARNAGRVVTKDALLDAVWPTVTVSEDSLTQTVSDLRRVLGGASDALRTMSGRGYMLLEATGDETPADLPPASALAVRPFGWVGASETDRVLVDGLVEEITHRLARFNLVPVLARHSAFSLAATDREGLRRLGIGYLLDGTLRSTSTGLAVSVTLTGVSGDVIWGDAFETTQDDMFALADTIPVRAMSQLVARLEADAFRETRTGSSFGLLIRGIAHLRSHGPTANEIARDLLRKAVEEDPASALAQSYLALTEVMIAGESLAPPEPPRRCRAAAGRRHAPRAARGAVPPHSRAGPSLCACVRFGRGGVPAVAGPERLRRRHHDPVRPAAQRPGPRP